MNSFTMHEKTKCKINFMKILLAVIILIFFAGIIGLSSEKTQASHMCYSDSGNSDDDNGGGSDCVGLACGGDGGLGGFSGGGLGGSGEQFGNDFGDPNPSFDLPIFA